jgi:L-asparagine transporter-like permease
VAGTVAYGVWSCLLVIIGGWLTQNRLPEMSLGFTTIDPNLYEKKPLFDVMTDYAMVGVISMATLAVAAIFPMRNREPGRDLPYRCPAYPFVPILYVVVMTWVLTTMFIEDQQRSEAIVGTAFIALGAVVYEVRFWSRR